MKTNTSKQQTKRIENLNASSPPMGRVLRLIYVDRDGKMSERLVRVTATDTSYWICIDLIKGQPERFLRAGLAVAQLVDDVQERQEIFERISAAGCCERRESNRPQATPRELCAPEF